MPCVKLLDECRQIEEGRQTLHGADAQGSSSQSLHGGHRITRIGNGCQRDPGLAEKHLACGGKSHLSRSAHEQLGLELGFQLADRSG